VCVSVCVSVCIVMGMKQTLAEEGSSRMAVSASLSASVYFSNISEAAALLL
jgi:hypothetical protein